MLGLVNGDVATDSLYDDEQVRKIMERHYEIMKEFSVTGTVGLLLSHRLLCDKMTGCLPVSNPTPRPGHFLEDNLLWYQSSRIVIVIACSLLPWMDFASVLGLRELVCK